MTTQMIPITDLDVWSLVQKKAGKLKISVSEYIRQLVLRDRDGSSAYKDPWGPVPAHVSKRWDEEERQFEEEEKRGEHKGYTDIEE